MSKKLFLSVTQLAVLSLSMSAPCALAGTSAYVTAGLLGGNIESCLKDMKTAADKAGFTESQETVMDDDKKAGDFHADQKGSPLHVTARCDPATGVWSIAVSGIDSQQTVNEFNRIMKAFE
jgi:hypothetical protein